jgi:tetratricopeptide (TPR) repeat protein
MGKNRRKQPPEKRVRASSIAVFIGALCLALGGIAGYVLHSKALSGAASAVSGGDARFAQAEARFRGLLLSDPRNMNALVQLGNLHYDRGDFHDAVEYYGRALDLEPANVDVRTDRGTSYWNLGEPDRALDEFRKSLDVDPIHAQTLFNFGVVALDGKKDAAAARTAWEKLLQAHPSYRDRAKVETLLASLPSKSADPEVREVEALLQRMKRP